jgi:hypothetical protein
MKAYLLVILLLLVGCASSQPKDAALLLVDQIDEYEAAIRDKILSEQTFYRDIRDALKEAAARQVGVDAKVATLNRITRLTDRAMVQDRGLQVSVLQQFLRDEFLHARTSEAERKQKQAELEANYSVSFDSLAFRQRQLGNTRTKLLALTQDQSIKDQLKKRIQEAGKMALELQKENDPNPE